MRALERINGQIEKRLRRKALDDLRKILVELQWGAAVIATANVVKGRGGQTLKSLAVIVGWAAKRRGFAGLRGG